MTVALETVEEADDTDYRAITLQYLKGHTCDSSQALKLLPSLPSALGTAKDTLLDFAPSC